MSKQMVYDEVGRNARQESWRFLSFRLRLFPADGFTPKSRRNTGGGESDEIMRCRRLGGLGGQWAVETAKKKKKNK